MHFLDGFATVLDRVKLFLPQIQKANLELEEKIKVEGAKSVQIDAGMMENEAEEALVEVVADSNDCDIQEEVEVEEDEEDSDKDAPEAGGATVFGFENDVKKSQICLEFALGDFDGTPLAMIDEEADSSEVGAALGSDSGSDDGDV